MDHVKRASRVMLILIATVFGPAAAAATAASLYSYTTIAIPGANSERAVKINDLGQVVGDYRDRTGIHGFLRDSDGTITTIDVPGGFNTASWGINNAGVIVGPYSNTHGYRLDGTTFTTIDVPDAVLTSPVGVNASGAVVGGYVATPGSQEQGFLLINGVFSTVSVPGSVKTLALGINGNGDIVGDYWTELGGPRGYLLRQGQFILIDAPGASITEAVGINDEGIVVGLYVKDGQQHGYILKDGTFVTVDVPDAEVTAIHGINNAGAIVGAYFDGVAGHGFLATPVLPETTITAHPASTTQETSASFAFSSDNASATFECRLDAASFETCASPRSYAGLAVGSHSFEVRAKNAVGNHDLTPDRFSWTIVPVVFIAVSAPNGGELWPIGATRNITWSSNGLTGNVKIEVSKDGGTTWTLITSSTANDGMHPWVVKGPATTQARIRVTSLTNPLVNDASNANLTIGGGTLSVQGPNGGDLWPIGATKNITWSSTGLTGNVKIEVSRNGGVTWALVAGTTANDGVHPWVVTGPPTTQARIRVTSLTDTAVADTSNANFTVGGGTVTVNTANGGEIWPIGATRNITWSSTGLTGNVKIEVSRNGGVTWAPIAGTTANDAVHPWIVTGPATSQTRIRVTSLTDPTVADTSNANFTIGGGTLTVNSPNGGEVWTIGATRNITWSSTGLTGNVKIEVSRNGGVTWAPIAGTTANDGVHPWIVTGPATSQTRIRVISLTDPTVADMTNADFSIP